MSYSSRSRIGGASAASLAMRFYLLCSNRFVTLESENSLVKSPLFETNVGLTWFVVENVLILVL